MISAIEISNFKCFSALRLSLGKLTMLTGFNASGKSTALQSILLLAQTLRKKERGADLWLNGSLLHLGNPGDVINQDQATSELILGFTTDELDLSWSMRAVEREDERVLRISTVRITEHQSQSFFEDLDELVQLLPANIQNEPAAKAVRNLRDSIYVSAVRQVETDLFPAPEDPDPIHADVGSYGEHAPWWFHQFDDNVVDEMRCAPASETRTLRGQVNAWLAEFFPGAEANAQPVPRTRFLRLEFRTGKTEEWRRPSNTGYGLGYAFPVLVAGLWAKKNQILVVDSPEAHLHPRGQSRMGRFLAQVAASGVQVVVETHSDHILNGIRLAIKDSIISPNDTAIYFFAPDRESHSGRSLVTALSVDKAGNLSNWPKGFFDQAESDLANLSGWV